MTDISQQLIEQINRARAEKYTLNIIGGGSKAFSGRVSQGKPIDVSPHRGIINYQPVELMVTVRAGTLLIDIERALEKEGQMLSFEPPNFAGKATIGGTLACNMSGPARPWGGSVRDMVLGVRLINGNGEHLRFGGEVMKNVAGYDVSRLQAGAMGAFGVITEISLKLLPKPAATVTLARAINAQDAIRVMNELAGKAKPLTAACWLNNTLYLRLAGAESAVKGTAAQWSGEAMENADHFWHHLREQQLAFFSGDEPLWRFSVKPSADHFFSDMPWLIDWGGAQRWFRGEATGGKDSERYNAATLKQAAITAGGQVGLFRGGDRTGEVFHPLPNSLKALHKRIKSAFDPEGLFNPGRLYRWL